MKNEYKVTWEVFKIWLAENRLKKPQIFFTAFWVVFGVCIIGMSVAYGYAPFMAFALLCFYRAFLRNFLFAKRQYKTLAKTYGQEDWLRTITFGEEEILLSEGNITERFRYSDIDAVKEKDNRAWILFKDQKVLRLYKDKFIDSDWDECKELIKRKQV